MTKNSSKAQEAVKVVVRIRPLNTTEIKNGNQVITTAYEDRGLIEVLNPIIGNDTGSLESSKQFSFDAVFSDKASQRSIYDICAAPVVQSVLEGYNGTIFAYGQTGAGKTHTMEGVPNDSELRGIIPNAFQHIFDQVALNDSKEKYLIRASYFEIYNEEIRDLISSTPKNSLDLRETPDSGVYVKGLTNTIVKSFSEITKLMETGKKNRSVGATQMNLGSSRSHAVFTIIVECCSTDESGQDHIRVGKLNLVDLAGSERQTKTGATGERLKEATKINLSLSALGNVISALVDGKSQHIPYRDSKLTRILQDSLGGNTKTVMCANAGPADYNYDETLSTLRYANRAKNIKNKPIVNEDPKDAMLREYQSEIAQLKAQLANMNMKEYKYNEDYPEQKCDDITNFKIDSELKLRKIKEEAEKERAVMEEKNKEQITILQTKNKETTQERKLLEKKLEAETKARSQMERQRKMLQEKLQDMEAQLMIGGEMATKASKQEAALRKAEQDLIAKRESEMKMARQMAEKEEENFQLNEKYSSLSDEVQATAKKLKKLWTKYQQAKMEIKDLHSEFQIERNDMLESIRDLSKQVKLKELVISNFIPPKYSKMFTDKANGGRAIWNENEEKWIIPRIDLACNKNFRFYEEDKELNRIHKQTCDPYYSRSKTQNMMVPSCLELPGPATQEYEGRNTVSNVNHLLNLDLNDDVLMYEVEIPQQYENRGDNTDIIPNPYLRYTKGNSSSGGDNVKIKGTKRMSYSTRKSS